MDELGKLAHIMGDDISDMSKMTGYVSNSKKGDMVVNVAGGSSIAIEVKDVGSITQDGASELLDDCMDNRDAAFALLVVKNVEAFPKSMGWFHEFGPSKLAIALGSASEVDADTPMHGEIPAHCIQVGAGARFVKHSRAQWCGCRADCRQT